MLKRIPTAPVLLFMAVGVAQAQTIRGQVFVPNPSFNERIEVRLEKEGGQLIATSFSDTTGVFLFYDTPSMIDGLFAVIKLDGYAPVKEPVPFGPAGTTNLKINLVRKEAASPADLSADPDVIVLENLSGRYSKKLVDEYQKAQDDSRKGNEAKAAERLQAVLKQAPDFYQAHNTLGTVFQKLGHLEDAEKEYDLAHKQNPKFALPLVNLGGLYLQLADARAKQGANAGLLLQTARDNLQEAVNLDSRSAMAYYLLGTVYYRAAAYPESEANLTRALQLERGMTQARLMSINLYSRQQKWESALEQIDAYLAENPKAADRNQIQVIRSKVIQNFQAAPK